MVSETKSFVYRNGQEYYAALKSVMVHGGRITKPKNLSDLVKAMERESNNTTMEAVFASSFAIMYEKHRNATAMARIARMKSSQMNANNARNRNTIKTKPKANKNNANVPAAEQKDSKDDVLVALGASAPKVTKENTIPQCMLESTSLSIKLAAIVHVHCESMPLFMLSLINDKNAATKTVAATIAFSHKSVADIKDYINTINNLETTTKERVALVAGLVTLANAFKLPSCARLAVEITSSGYDTYIEAFLKIGDLNPITNAAAYEPIISKYIKDSVPRIQQAEERHSIAKQMQVNVSSTITNILKQLRKTETVSISGGITSNTVADLDPDTQYEYYRGPTNYTRDIITTYCMHEGRRYRILTYNDCLYDVIGYSVENTDSKGQHKNDCELFDRLKWSERLRMLDYYTTISLKSATGAELSEMLSCDGVISTQKPPVDETSESNKVVSSIESPAADTDNTTAVAVTGTTIDAAAAAASLLKLKAKNQAMMSGGGDVTITWLNDKHLLCSKTLPIKKTKKKVPLKNQQQQQQRQTMNDDFGHQPNYINNNDDFSSIDHEME